jgi:uroporphyrinogen III methyltransferase/synthase
MSKSAPIRNTVNSAGAEKPLDGRNIVVTRARAQAGVLAQRITELGGVVIECPTIEIQPPSDFLAFDRGAIAARLL